jgi:glycosyltransferase involved in cell wall biosynthesis
VFVLASMAYEHSVTAALRCFSPRFFAVSAASAQWLRHFGIREAPIVPNGIMPRSDMPIRNKNTFESPVIFFAGRLLPEKGIRELVDAVESLVHKGMRVKLRVAGQGPLSAMLEERASQLDFLVYLGRLSPSEVAAELDRASVFVNPSNLPEGLPTTLLEAGASALPVISTARGGSTELIRDGLTGWIIPRGDVDSIASCLRDVIAQPDEAIRRGAALFRLVQEGYTWPTIVGKFLGYVGSGIRA